ncbi:MAG: hypothetical protein GC149_07100 [Gammaproteobacteria bacterium]|nr:hypothetical protein [Gammaproteobacteria bacterium]
MKSKNKLIVVVGMHRSGTNLVAKTINDLGVDIGKDFIDKAEDNIKGFRENRDLNSINIKFLHAIGSEWDRVGVTSINQENPAICQLMREAENILKNAVKNKSIFGLIDPRVSILLPVWSTIFQKLELVPNYIICLRNPLNVIESLAKRNNFHPVKSELLWLKYNLETALATAKYNHLFVNYDRLIDETHYEIRRLSSFIHGLNRNDCESSLAKLNIDRNLRHSVFTYEDLMSSTLLDMTKELYKILLTCQNDKLDTEKINDFLIIKCNQYIALHRILDYIDELDMTNTELKSHAIKLHMGYLEKERLYNLVVNSVSWALTSPFRFISRLLRK